MNRFFVKKIGCYYTVVDRVTKRQHNLSDSRRQMVDLAQWLEHHPEAW
jgi:hypothetical protein